MTNLPHKKDKSTKSKRKNGRELVEGENENFGVVFCFYFYSFFKIYFLYFINSFNENIKTNMF